MPSPKGQSRSLQFQGRELLTPDEVLRLRGPEKKGSDIVKAGDMIVLVAGFAPVYGRQILYFKNPVFLQRAQISPPGNRDIMPGCHNGKDYSAVLGKSAGIVEARQQPEDSPPDLDEFMDDDVGEAQGTEAEQAEQPDANTPNARDNQETIDADVIAGDADDSPGDEVDEYALQSALDFLSDIPEFDSALNPDDDTAWRPDAARLDLRGDKRGFSDLMGTGAE